MMVPFLAILRKDLRLELRGGESSVTMAVLSVLVLVVIVLAFGPAGERRLENAAGALWVALIMAGMLGATRNMLAERESGCLRGLLLSPVDPTIVFAAKSTATFALMALAEIAALLMVMLFFNLEAGAVGRLLPVVLLGSLGMAPLATLLAAVSGRLRAGDMLLPVLLVPLFVPALIAGVRCSATILNGGGMAQSGPWLSVLLAFDVMFLVAGYLLFEFVLRED